MNKKNIVILNNIFFYLISKVLVDRDNLYIKLSKI